MDEPDGDLDVTDDEVVALQLDRTIRGQTTVASRCHLDLPVVVGVSPILEDGTPFPTRWWLTCPLARVRIDRLESAGGVRQMDRQLAANSDWQDRMEAAHLRYATERDALVPANAEHRPSGGVAGMQGAGLKCLHAHYADARQGGDNPVGMAVVPFVEPLDCPTPCVAAGTRNPDWVEPK